jgi:chromosome segregation ATPase
MVQEQRAGTAMGLGWIQDQVYQLKADVGQLDQQLVQLQSLLTQLTDSMRGLEVSVRDTSTNAALAPRLQEELNQTVALIVHLQDQQAEANQQLDALGRHREVEQNREQLEWTEMAKRLELLERQVAQWLDRQAGVDEVGRRFQEGMSLVRQELQQIDQRLETVESKAGRALEGATRAEHTLTQVEAALLELQRSDDALTERTRVASDVAHRLESNLGQQLQDLQRLELLTERVELHRAERQRLEDRALRLEEELGELRGRTERVEQQDGRLGAQQQGLASRLDAFQEHVELQRVALVEQLRRLTSSQERTKRRQIQELEREVREMRKYVADLADQ